MPMNRAAWLSSRLFMSTIEKKFSYYVGKDLSDAQAKMDENLNNLTMNGLLSMKARIQEFDVQRRNNVVVGRMEGGDHVEAARNERD